MDITSFIETSFYWMNDGKEMFLKESKYKYDFKILFGNDHTLCKCRTKKAEMERFGTGDVFFYDQEAYE